MAGPAEPFKTGGRERYILEGFEGGLHSEATFSKVQLSDSETPCAQNVEFWPIGTVSKRGGRSYKNYGTPLSGAVTQVYQWWSDAGANYLMTFEATSGTCSAQVHYVSSESGNTCTFANILTAGQDVWNPGEDNDIIAETYGGSAVFCNGVDPLFAWNATSCSCIMTAPSGATCIRGYKNYLFLADAVDTVDKTRHQSRIWWSDPGDGHTWPVTNYLDLDANDGDYITGMELLGNELIVFKERKIYAITYVGGLYDFYAEARVSGVGCPAGNSIIPIFSELCFYGIENFYSFNGRDVESLADKAKDMMTNTIVPDYRARIRGTMYEEKDQLWWLVPIDSDTTSGNSHGMILDYNRDCWTIFTLPGASITWYNAASDLAFGDLTDPYSSYDLAFGDRLFLSNSSSIVIGTYDGYLVECGTSGVTNDLGEDYEGFWRSRWIDFGMPDTNKRVTRMTVYLDKEVENEADDYNLYLYIYKDWDLSTPAIYKTISVYGTYPVLERRVDFTFNCRALQLQIGTTLKAQPFTIHKIVVEYIPKGRTLVI